jgi:D-sedoheptulose 7-phosphate isomerase
MDSELKKLFSRYPELEPLKNKLQDSASLMIQSVKRGGTIFTCGNGGSASDAEHIVGELVKSFARKRPIPESDRQLFKQFFPDDYQAIEANLEGGISAVCLMSGLAINTAFANDKSYEFAVAQHLYALGKPGDVLIAISTSGNSKNVINACKVAKIRNIPVIGLTGHGGGKLAQISDICLNAPANEVHEIQELHSPIYHYLCIALEDAFFVEKRS